MAEIARIRWQSSLPTSVDEELAVYDDATALLVVRTSRDGAPVIGTWKATVAPADLVLLQGQRREVDVRHLVPDAVMATADRVAADARDTPVATATFHTGVVPGGGVALLAVGGGTAPAAFELDVDSVVVHLEDDGKEVAWHRMERLETGFVSPEPAGLGGVGRPAEIAPGAYGGIALAGPPLDAAGAVAVAVAIEVAGYLRDGLPEQVSYQRFSVRTAAVPLSG
jgi:hypothetical protein